MQRVALLFLLLFTISLQLTAQETGDLNLDIGLHGGGGFSSITIRPYQPTSSRPALVLGITIRVLNTKIGPLDFGLQLEGNYSHLSYATTNYTMPNYNQIAPEDNRAISLTQWIAMPLMLLIQWKTGYFCLQATGGAFADYLLNETFGPKEGFQHMSKHPSTYQILGFGAGGGAAIGVDTPIGTFLIEYRSNYRLANLYRRELLPGADQPRSNIKTQLFGLVYYYSFTINKKH